MVPGLMPLRYVVVFMLPASIAVVEGAGAMSLSAPVPMKELSVRMAGCMTIRLLWVGPPCRQQLVTARALDPVKVVPVAVQAVPVALALFVSVRPVVATQLTVEVARLL